MTRHLLLAATASFAATQVAAQTFSFVDAEIIIGGVEKEIETFRLGRADVELSYAFGDFVATVDLNRFLFEDAINDQTLFNDKSIEVGLRYQLTPQWAVSGSLQRDRFDEDFFGVTTQTRANLELEYRSNTLSGSLLLNGRVDDGVNEVRRQNLLLAYDIPQAGRAYLSVTNFPQSSVDDRIYFAMYEADYDSLYVRTSLAGGTQDDDKDLFVGAVYDLGNVNILGALLFEFDEDSDNETYLQIGAAYNFSQSSAIELAAAQVVTDTGDARALSLTYTLDIGSPTSLRQEFAQSTTRAFTSALGLVR